MLPKVPVMQVQVAGGVVNAAACMEENACYWLILVNACSGGCAGVACQFVRYSAARFVFWSVCDDCSACWRIYGDSLEGGVSCDVLIFRMSLEL